ncbi:hypothetical protein EJB05_15609 [Eragrostis curvula]|uniref:Uncharacterized protein n=1 Tax=Eragrostis curvula TaxID=38414 RepID=A0A5J9VED1_9POAL|nr:hypothetical protein EJB05_15609 [Eragrostis curvula]
MSSDEQAPSSDEDASSESSGSDSMCQSRRSRSSAQWPIDKMVVTEIGDDGMPIAQDEKRRMRKLAGLIARQKVSLLLPNFAALKKKGKKDLFDSWVMPYLEFNEDMYAKALKRAMKGIAKCWRDHKCKLINEFMLQGRSPFERFKFLKREDWDAFVKLKTTDLFKQESEKMRQLREKNKHPHRLGTAGYDGKIPKWEAEDAQLAKEGKPNPWHLYPGRSQPWLRARGILLENGEISFKSQETKEVSDRIKQLSEHEVCNDDIQHDSLTKGLGNKEHPGRVRAFSSYDGWKRWPGYKKKRGLSPEDMKQLTEQLRAQVTQDIISNIPNILAAQGFKIVPISPCPNQVSPGEARKSSCASVGNGDHGNGEHDMYAEMMHHTGFDEPDSIDLLSEPTQCALLSIIGGYQIEVARGLVYPQQKVLHCVNVNDDCAVVFVDHVRKKHRDNALPFPPNDEITSLGQALLQRIQWKRSLIVLNPMEMEASDPESPPRPQERSQGQRVKPREKEQRPKKARSDSKLSDKAQPAKRARSDSTRSEKKKAKVTTTSPESATRNYNKPGIPKPPLPSVWAKPNAGYCYGKAMLSPSKLRMAGPQCLSLHNLYANGCNVQKTYFSVRFKSEHFLRPSGDVFTVDYGDLYDLFTFDALDFSIIRSFSLYLAQKVQIENKPVAVLDPQCMSFSVIEKERSFTISYVEKALSLANFSKKKYLMFACNTGGHWIAVVLSIKWCTVWYIDSMKGNKFDTLINLLDESFANFIKNDPRRKLGMSELKHITTFQCHQQPIGAKSCGFYTAYHLLYAASISAKLTNPEDFILPSESLGDSVLSDLRERMAGFFMNQVVAKDGEFHEPSCGY